MAGILISPRFDYKARKRCESYKKRNGSPNFKDILRERCRARIKAKRGDLFEKMRNSNQQALHDTLSGILREEVSVLTSPLKPKEEMDVEGPTFGFWEIKEFENNEDQWLLEEYEKVLAEEEAIFGSVWEEQVICPLCELGVLGKNKDGLVRCPHCDSSYPSVQCLKTLQKNLNSSIEFHNQTCSILPDFTLITDSLFLICEHCGCMFQVI